MRPALHNLERVLRTLHRARQLYWRLLEPPMLGVRALILDGDGASVMLVRHTYLDGWYLPGGRVDRGETAEQALRREVAEECGLQVEAARLLGIYNNAEVNRNDHILLFSVDRFTAAGRPRWLEIAEARFFPLEALPEGTTPATRRRLAEHARAEFGGVW
ncbi:MAG: NUDIX domain-containing protein [Myxococcales bacterium]|nr:NUDIX domain-containing protein [Myxococcota bacterium]MDW8283479.1 NUDIX domain-containing protein [Myxococcales bacterium]